MLTNTTNPLLEDSLQKLPPAAEQLHVLLDLFDIRSSDEIEGALLRLIRRDSTVSWLRPRAILRFFHALLRPSSIQ
jgi:hypothetical protein